MNDYYVSRECIDEYLKLYHLRLRSIEDRYGGDFIDGVLKLYKNKRKIGHLTFDLDRETRELHINLVQIKIRDKENIPVKLFKVMLLYLISLYEKYINIVTLTALPSKDISRRGTEFCLPCYYQKIGFEPINIDVKKALKKCRKDLQKLGNPIPKKHLCILCECQKRGVPLEINPYHLSRLSVDMKALLPRMRKELRETYKKLCK